MTSTTRAKVLPSPDILAEYFDLGKDESISPFLLPGSRSWSANLNLKASLLAACLLVLSFAVSFSQEAAPLSNILLVSVYFLAGIPSLIEALEDLSNGDVNIDILMTLAAFSSVFIGSGMEGALLLVLFALSGSMEDAVTAKAKGAISSLHKLSPTKASVVEEDGTLIDRSIKDIPVGASILVKASQIVPLDGNVIQGTTSLNLVHLTGENLPVTKSLGDEVPAGALNLDGAITVQVTRTSADSTLSKIVQLVTEAQEARPKLQRWFDELSKSYAITIISLSAFFALTFPFIFSIPFLGEEGSLYRAIAFLIAASPCALIIAIPIAYLSAISSCAKRGILLKGGLTLDALAKCSVVAFDKTGTLTTGDLTFLGIESLEKKEENLSKDKIDEALAVAYALEKNAVHPIASAIIRHAKTQSAALIHLNEFKAIAGYGLEAIAILSSGSKLVSIGRPSYIAKNLPNELREQLTKRANEMEATGELLAALTIGDEAYLFRFSDTIRDHISETLSALEKRGWESVMLTGDHLEGARRIASQIGLKNYYASLSPKDKLHHVTTLSEEKGLVMIGDGVNDAPALARATIGICMGKVGSTTAIEAADIVLLHDNIELLDWLIGKAKLTQKIVRQNLTLATVAIFAASLPALGGIIPLWLAVVMHEGGTVLVGLNALRLLKRK